MDVSAFNPQRSSEAASSRSDAARTRRARPPRADSLSTMTGTTQSHPEIHDFLLHLEKERDVSKHTLTAYSRDLDEFVDYLGSYYGANAWSWQRLDRLAIRAFLGYLPKKMLDKPS